MTLAMKNLFKAVLSLMFVYVSTLPLNNDWDNLIRSRRDTANCQPPTNVDELFRRLNENVDTSVFFRPSSSSGNDRPLLHGELNSDQVSESVYGPSLTCPDKASDNPDDPLWMRSLCPWYYNMTELSSDHYPRFIPQAVCKCSNCIDSNLNQCERVSTNIRVLKKTGCQEGFVTYKPETITHYVGCTCAKRRTTTSAPDSTAPETTTAAPCNLPFGCIS